MASIENEALLTCKLRAIPESFESACRKVQFWIESGWNQSVKEVMRETQGMVQTDFNIPQLLVKAMKINSDQVIEDSRSAELK